MAYYGIDLGTSNTLAVRLEEGFEPGEVELFGIDLDDGSESFPSVVSFLNDNQYVVGEKAQKRLTDYPDSTVELVKIRLGQTSAIPVRIGNCSVQKSPQEISALFLKHIRNACGEDIVRPVITVPATFDTDQKEATKQAGIIAEIEPGRLIEEPTAAIIYQIYKKYHDEGTAYLDSCSGKNYLVFDFGGGTLDLSLISINYEDGEIKSEVLDKGGNNRLGGNLIDFLLTKYIIDAVVQRNPHDVFIAKVKAAFDSYFNNYIENSILLFPDGVTSDIKNFIFIIKREAERVKIQLSSKDKATIVLGRNYEALNLTRQKFEEYVFEDNDYINFPSEIEDAINELNRNFRIDEVLLVGGSSEIPFIKNEVQTLIRERGGKSDCIKSSVDSLHAVVYGAAIQAALEEGIAVFPFNKNKFSSVVYRDINISCGGNSELFIKSGTPYPFAGKQHSIRIPHSLSVDIPIRISETDRQRGGATYSKTICDYKYYLPFYYTGDEMVVSMEIDNAGLYKVTAKHLRTKEIIEFEPEKAFSLSDPVLSAKQKEIALLDEV